MKSKMHQMIEEDPESKDLEAEYKIGLGIFNMSGGILSGGMFLAFGKQKAEFTETNAFTVMIGSAYFSLVAAVGILLYLTSYKPNISGLVKTVRVILFLSSAYLILGFAYSTSMIIPRTMAGMVLLFVYLVVAVISVIILGVCSRPRNY